jgi:hypothetical protein
MEFRILGPLEVWDEGGEVSLGGRKPRALLAVLLLHPNEVVSADRLIDELWGEDSPERAHADPLRPVDVPSLLAYLATIHDPRRGRGRRHPLVAILAMAAAAVLTGARSMTAIAEWAADTPQPARAALGTRRDAPDRWAVPAEATIRRTLALMDPTALAAVIGAWLADRERRGQPHRRRAVAVDGETLRGARRDGRQVMACPGQPGHRRAQPGRAGQPRRRAAPPCPRPRPAPGHPRHHPRMNMDST